MRNNSPSGSYIHKRPAQKVPVFFLLTICKYRFFFTFVPLKLETMGYLTLNNYLRLLLYY